VQRPKHIEGVNKEEAFLCLCGQRLMNDRWLRSQRNVLPFYFLLALLVGCALPRGDFVEGAPFRFHPHMGVARKAWRARRARRCSMITSSPAPDSESSVTSVWRFIVWHVAEANRFQLIEPHSAGLVEVR